MSLAHSLDQLHRHFARVWADTSARPGTLTFSEYEYLRAIERLDGAQIASLEKDANSAQEDHPDNHPGHPGHHLQDLVEVLGVQKASASAAIAKLEKRDLVERFPCQFDARAQHVMLTNKARLHLRTEEAVYSEAAKRIAEQLDPQELECLTSALAKLENKI